MLRITSFHEDGTVWVALEGNLAGPWVAESRAACARAEAEGRDISLDLTEVRFVDSEGVAFLREMAGAGKVRKSSRFVAELLRSGGSR